MPMCVVECDVAWRSVTHTRFARCCVYDYIAYMVCSCCVAKCAHARFARLRANGRIKRIHYMSM